MPLMASDEQATRVCITVAFGWSPIARVCFKVAIRICRILPGRQNY